MDNNVLLNVAIDNFKGAEHLPIDYLDTDIVIIDNFANINKVEDMKLQMNLFASCYEGKVSFEVLGITYELKAGETMICPSGTILANAMASPDINVSLIGLSDRIMNSVLVNNIDIWNKAVYGKSIHIVKRPPETKEMSESFAKVLKKIIEWKKHPFREEMVRSMLQIVILSICAYFKFADENPEENSDKKSPTGRIIFNKFMDMLKKEDIKHRPVYYYANQLCITAKYLSHICKEISGKSANEFIQAAVMNDIEYYLRNSTISVKEISQKLGFANISFFGKYVKAYSGLSPNAYRKQIFSENHKKN